MSYPRWDSVNSPQPHRQSMYSPQPDGPPPPPPRPQSAYEPYPHAAGYRSPSPVPPPRPSSAYIAPFPGTRYHEPPPSSSSMPGQWEPQAHSHLKSNVYAAPTLQPQPQPFPTFNPSQTTDQNPIAPPPRTTSLYSPSIAVGHIGSPNPANGYAGETYGVDRNDNVSPLRAFPSPQLTGQPPAPPVGHFASAPTSYPTHPSFSSPSGGISFPSSSSVPSIASALQALSIDTRPETSLPDMPSSHQIFPSSSSSSTISSASTATEPPRVYTLPTVEGLQATSSTLDSAEDGDQIAWAQDVIRLIDRHLNPTGGPTDFTHPDASPPTTAHLTPTLRTLLEMAVPIIIVVSTSPNTRAAASACYLKARLQSSGLCPDMLPKNQRQAFKDFEASARAGEVRGWFRLGGDYEGVNDMQRAIDCYERGIKRGDCECTYRMGMAHLLGQLNLPTNPSSALSLLRQASDRSTIDFPQPSYVYGMLLAGELSVPTEIPSHLVLPPSSAPSDTLYAQWSLARDAIERAAYFCYPPAQYKAGHLYEHAALGCAYDPLVSVNWYMYASKNDETEADMALSKWFLCGAEGHVPKNENLAKTFAEKAARKGHPNGCFALGYYYELGVGGRRDLDQAKKWYQKAANLGNTDAPARLAALSAPVPTSMSMAEHESRLNDTLVRRRTQAKIRSDRASISRPARRTGPAQPVPLSMPSPSPAFSSPRPEIRTDWGPVQGPSQGQSAYTFPTPNSPAPKVGEIMCPNPNYNANANPNPNAGYKGQGYNPSSNSFPSRPPIPHQSFHAQSQEGPESQTFPRRQSHDQDKNANGNGPGRKNGNGNGRRFTGTLSAASLGSGVSASTSLSDLPIPERRNDEPRRPKKEAQTFAEMGFVSKPVEEEGCSIM